MSINVEHFDELLERTSVRITKFKLLLNWLINDGFIASCVVTQTYLRIYPFLYSYLHFLLYLYSYVHLNICLPLVIKYIATVTSMVVFNCDLLIARFIRVSKMNVTLNISTNKMTPLLSLCHNYYFPNASLIRSNAPPGSKNVEHSISPPRSTRFCAMQNNSSLPFYNVPFDAA